MSLTVTSSRINAAKPATVSSKYNFNVKSTVSSEAAVVDEKAKAYYNTIYSTYTNLNTHFKALATAFTSASKYCTGTLQTKAKKCATACQNQGTYCTNRRTQLKELYKYAELESRIASLEAALDALEKEDASNNTGAIQ